MEQAEGVNASHRFEVKCPESDIQLGSGPEDQHPFSPPFSMGEYNAGRLDSFYRGAIAPSEYVVFAGGAELIRTVQSLLQVFGKTDDTRRVFFCEPSEIEKMNELHTRLPGDRTVLVVLSRRFDEMELLALSLACPAWNRVFLAPTHGPLAEGARLLRIPFFPVDLNFNRFWHNSELFYLPLATMGFKPELIHNGFMLGYRDGMIGSRQLASRLWRMDKTGCRWLFFLARNPFFRVVVESVIPLLDESSSSGETRIAYRAVSSDTFKEHYLEEACRYPAGTCVLWLDEPYRCTGPRIDTPDALRENIYLDGRFFDLQGKPFDLLPFSELKSFSQYLGEQGMTMVNLSGFREDDCSMGGLLAICHLLACYNAWLREIDLFNDPARVEADGRTWDTVASQEQRTRGKKNRKSGLPSTP